MNEAKEYRKTRKLFKAAAFACALAVACACIYIFGTAGSLEQGSVTLAEASIREAAAAALALGMYAVRTLAVKAEQEAAKREFLLSHTGGKLIWL